MPSSSLPGGSVRLIYNGQVLGIATLHLVNGVETATFNVTYFANGLYVFSAQYVTHADPPTKSAFAAAKYSSPRRLNTSGSLMFGNTSAEWPQNEAQR